VFYFYFFMWTVYFLLFAGIFTVFYFCALDMIGVYYFSDESEEEPAILKWLLPSNPIKDHYKNKGWFFSCNSNHLFFQVLGVGINGKVVECESLKTGELFALKILREVPKAKREAELHFLACTHPNIVKIFEVYENTYNGIACLFLIIECMNGELFTRIQVVFLNIHFYILPQFFRSEQLLPLPNGKQPT